MSVVSGDPLSWPVYGGVGACVLNSITVISPPVAGSEEKLVVTCGGNGAGAVLVEIAASDMTSTNQVFDNAGAGWTTGEIGVSQVPAGCVVQLDWKPAS